MQRLGTMVCGVAVILSVVRIAPGWAAEAEGADRYPSKPVRFILANATGSSADVLVRILSGKLSEQMGQPVVVDAKPGGSGVVGTVAALAAPPDGYTLLQSGNVFTTITALRPNLPFNVDRDFIGLTKIAWVENVLAVHGGLNVGSVAEFISLAKSRPGSLNYGSAGNASPSHISGALLDVLAGVKTVHVPYKGTAQALADTMSGQLQFLITSPLVVAPQANSGRIRVLATTGPKRSRQFPDLPTVSETVRGYEVTQWWGVAVHAKTPAPIVTRLHQENYRALQDAGVRNAMAKYGATVDPQSIEEFASFVRTERNLVADLARKAGITDSE